MQPQERLQDEVKTAMKARDAERVSTLRMLLSEVKNEKIRLGHEVDEAAFVAVVRRAVKQRHDAVAQYRAGNRPELAAKEEREIVILETFLPQQAGEAEVRGAIESFVAAQGLSGPKGMGPVMKAMKERFGATADGATLNRIAREVLGG